MEINNLNIPPNEEPIGKTLSRWACQLIIPVLMPASTVVVAWLAHRHISVQLGKLHQEEEAILSEEKESTEKILNDLEELRPLLRQRQDTFCDRLQSRLGRLKVEERLKEKASAKPYDKELGLSVGMEDILEHDNSCGGKTNGCLMWVYLELWQTRAQLLKGRRVANRMKMINKSFTALNSDEKE